VVDNPTEEDWNTSAWAWSRADRISCRMNLTIPLYIQRPLVEPELVASLRPPTLTGRTRVVAKRTPPTNPSCGRAAAVAGKGEGKAGERSLVNEKRTLQLATPRTGTGFAITAPRTCSKEATPNCDGRADLRTSSVRAIDQAAAFLAKVGNAAHINQSLEAVRFSIYH